MSVRPLASALALLAAGGVLTACSTVGNGRLARLDAASAAQILVPDRTTAAEARQALGDGKVIRFQSGVETWQYFFKEGLAKGWDDVPYIGLVTARIQRPTRELVLLFDARGMLKRYSLQETRPAP